MKRQYYYLIPLSVACIFCASPSKAQQNFPKQELVNSAVISAIRDFTDTEIVRLSIEDQNKKYGNMSEEEILKLDNIWREETKSDEQPLISATLSNPLSSYLTRVQARAAGLYTEMFAMDSNGLNVGQSNISSDYWQGDEAKFQKTYPKAINAVFVDDPEYDSKLNIWRVQVNLAIANENNSKNIGAITVEINLSELQRRNIAGVR